MNLGCQVVLGSVFCKPVLEMKGSPLPGPFAITSGVRLLNVRVPSFSCFFVLLSFLFHLFNLLSGTGTCQPWCSCEVRGQLAGRVRFCPSVMSVQGAKFRLSVVAARATEVVDY